MYFFDFFFQDFNQDEDEMLKQALQASIEQA